jgi:hypothetical protein
MTVLQNLDYELQKKFQIPSSKFQGKNSALEFVICDLVLKTTHLRMNKDIFYSEL